MFLSELPREAMPPLSDEQMRQALECADLGMPLRSAAIVLGVRVVRIPKRQYAATFQRGRLRRIRGLFGPVPATIHEFMRSN